MASVDSLISVVVPVRNVEKYIAEALWSISEVSEFDIDIIVIDDGSTDRTADVVRSLRDDRIRLISTSGSGIAAAVNRGIVIARGEFLARCDGDDQFVPGRLAKQAGWLRSHEEFAAICGRYSILNSQGQELTVIRTGDSAEEITEELQDGRGRTHLGTFLLRTSLVRQIGGCREWFSVCEDADLQLRLSEAGRIWYEPMDCYRYRIHEQSITHRIDSARREFFDQKAREFQCQRRQRGADDLQLGKPPAPPEKAGAPTTARQQAWEMLIGQAWLQRRSGRTAGIKAGWRVCMTEPWRWRSWKNLGVLAVKNMEKR